MYVGMLFPTTELHENISSFLLLLLLWLCACIGSVSGAPFCAPFTWYYLVLILRNYISDGTVYWFHLRLVVNSTWAGTWIAPNSHSHEEYLRSPWNLHEQLSLYFASLRDAIDRREKKVNANPPLMSMSESSALGKWKCSFTGNEIVRPMTASRENNLKHIHIRISEWFTGSSPLSIDNFILLVSFHLCIALLVSDHTYFWKAPQNFLNTLRKKNISNVLISLLNLNSASSRHDV